MENSKTDFLDILTIQNDEISYVKHVLDPPHVFFTLFGRLDAGKGLGHNVLMQFSTLSSSKTENQNVFQFMTMYPNPLCNRIPALACVSALLKVISRPSPLFEVPCRRQ